MKRVNRARLRGKPLDSDCKTANTSTGEEVNAEVQEINAELRKVTMNIPARFRGEPPRAYLLYIGEDERNTCYVRIKPTGRMTVFYDEECKHWRAKYDTKSEKTKKEKTR